MLNPDIYLLQADQYYTEGEDSTPILKKDVLAAAWNLKHGKPSAVNTIPSELVINGELLGPLPDD